MTSEMICTVPVKKGMNSFSNFWLDAYNKTVGESYATSSEAVWPTPWVNPILCDGNEGVGACVVNNKNSIGYVVLRTAQEYDLNMASIGTPDSSVIASSTTVSFAVGDKGLDFGNNGDDASRLTADLINPGFEKAWPISGYARFLLRLLLAW